MDEVANLVSKYSPALGPDKHQPRTSIPADDHLLRQGLNTLCLLSYPGIVNLAVNRSKVKDTFQLCPDSQELILRFSKVVGLVV